MFCFLFSVVFALFIGATTLNFGTLVRYKIPCLPFYIISLYLLNEKIIARDKARKETIVEEIIPQLDLYTGSSI